MDDVILETVGLYKAFDRNEVLKGVDFRLRRGSVHAIVGQNGAGKSTLMKILNGYQPQDQGEYFVGGEGCSFRSTADAMAKGIAMVYQDLSLVPDMTVAENIFLGRGGKHGLGLYNFREQADLAQSLLANVGVDRSIRPDAKISDLSPGQQQLVEIAKALAGDVKVLILDEPTASLANAEIAILFDAINRLKAEGLSIIYITHYLKDIFDICDDVTVLRDGRAVYSDRTENSSVEVLIAEMLGSAPTINPLAEAVRTPFVHSGKPLLEARNITTDRIHDVSMALYPGEIVGLAGLLGSGRTEILRALFGLDPIQQGKLLVDDVEQAIRTPENAIDKGIYLVPEDRRSQGLVMDFSVEDNILLSSLSNLSERFLLNTALGRSISRNFIRDLQVKTSGPTQKVRFLSGGNQQKVVIAKSLCRSARILLLDDPTFGVDIGAKREIMTIIRSYVAEGNAALFVSSEYSEIAAVCDKTYIVNRRTVTDCIKNENLTEDALMKAVQ